MFIILVTLVLAIVASIAMYIISEVNRGEVGHPLRKYSALPFLIPVLTLVFESFTIVPAGHVGVQVTMGTVNPSALHAGVNFVNPISNVRDVEIRVKRADLKEAQAGTKDLQQVHTDIVIQYRMNPEKVPTIYSQFGLNVDDKILGPGVNEAFKAVKIGRAHV